MDSKELSKKVVNGMKWKSIERLFLQVINAVTPMVLARILMPEDFGTVAILSVFISIANTFVNNGLCNSIIQKKESDNTDCSTVFYTQFAIALICYAILFGYAPLIAGMYDNPELSAMLRVMSLSVVIGSFGAMQITVMKKNMEFHKSFAIYGSATVAYGLVGISMAYLGFGCWSLVYAGLANSLFQTLAAVIMVRWKPMVTFSFSRLKTLFSYSWKLTVGWLVGTLHQDLYTLVVGKRFSKVTLGYYNRAGSFPQIIVKTITEVVDGVMFPAMSRIQDDQVKLKSAARNLITMNSYLIFPLFFGLAATAENMVTLLITEKWLPCVPMMQIICITYSLNSLNNSNMQVFNSMGRSDIFMKFELIKRGISIILLVVTSFISIYAVILVLLMMAVISNMMNAFQNNKLLGYKYSEFLKDALPSFLLAAVMAICTWCVGFVALPAIVSLLLQIVCGVAVYFALSYILKFKAFSILINILRKRNG